MIESSVVVEMVEGMFWAVTAFYNPARYQRRLRNFHEFRGRLGVPLVVVELADQGQFQLVPSDAELLLQLEGDVRIWQKERLVNLGIRALPREVEYVAWLDCDVIFLNSGWAAEAKRQLERGATVVQLFEQARHLAPGWEPGRSGGEALDRAETLFYEESFASALAAGTYFGVDRHGGRGRVEAEQGRFDFSRPPVASGMAWAAKRRWIETVQLYDACVIGGGDRAFALAASGRSDLLCRRRPMTQDHALHYAEWAQQLNNQEETSLGVVSGELLHLWHGQYARRNYRERHQLLTELHFNPYDDLATAENGSLRWAEHANKLGNAVAEYFVSRREDGEYRPVACSAWTKQGPC